MTRSGARPASDRQAAQPGQPGQPQPDGGRHAGVVVAAEQVEQPAAADTAQLRILLTLPAARGLGVGTTLVQTCLDFARAADYSRMILWTNDVLVAARRIYLASGFRLIAEEPHHSFGVDLVGQTYEIHL